MPFPRVIQVSTADVAGGAERVALDIHTGLLGRSYDARLLVGTQYGDFPQVEVFPNDSSRNSWSRFMLKFRGSLSNQKGIARTLAVAQRRICHILAEPRRAWRKYQGFDDFDFPGTSILQSYFPDETSPNSPRTIIHLHNLHGGYFDLRVLPEICKKSQVVLTAHDTWLSSGHCAYSIDCDAYLSGCGRCPHLSYPPAAMGDKTNENWILKRDIFKACEGRVHLVSPSKWTIDILQNSIFAPAIASTTVIPNGVDVSVFQTAEKSTVRKELGIDQDASVLTFTVASETNPFKDFSTIKYALALIARDLPEQKLVFIAIGATPLSVQIEGVKVICTGFLSQPHEVAKYLQAADIHLHAAMAEVFCLAIIEAEACGIPVITTNVGGTADTIIENETGMLVPRQDAAALACAAVELINSPERRSKMGKSAHAHALANLTQDKMIDRYYELYEEISRSC